MYNSTFKNQGKGLKRSGFKKKAGTPLKRTPFVVKPENFKPMRRTKIRVKGHSTTTELKDDIQALVRRLALHRDKGCVLAGHPETGACGGFRKDGKLILQFDHLNSRSHAISFAEVLLGVILCQHHHINWKKQNPTQFTRIIRELIGPARCNLLDRVQQDYKAYKADWKLVKVVLEQEVRKLPPEEEDLQINY